MGAGRVRTLPPHPCRAAACPLSPPACPAETAAGSSAPTKLRDSPEVPRPPVPQHPSGKSRSALQEAKTEHRNPVKLKPGCAAGWVTAARHARTHDPSRAPLLQCVRTNHRDHLRRLARYSPPRDRPASPPPAPPSYIRDRGGVLVPRRGGFQRATRNQLRKGDPNSTSPEC